MNQMKVYAFRQGGDHKISLLLKQITGGEGSPVVVQTGTLTMVPATDGAFIPPTVRLETDEAQQLMDALWDCGLRPTEGKGSAGALAATQRHLDDMRKLVGHAFKLKKEL